MGEIMELDKSNESHTELAKIYLGSASRIRDTDIQMAVKRRRVPAEGLWNVREGLCWPLWSGKHENLIQNTQQS